MNAPEDALIAKAAGALDDGLFRMHGLVSSCDHTDEAWAVLAAVRDQIAAEALREAASAIDSGDADHEELRQSGIDGISPRGWSEASVIAAHDVGSVWATWLHARADRLNAEDAP